MFFNNIKTNYKQVFYKTTKLIHFNLDTSVFIIKYKNKYQYIVVNLNNLFL